jgi:uncharacterized protein with PQ loop repeat
MVLVEAAAWVATTIAVVGVLPQVTRLLRTGDAVGVSLVAPMFGVASESGWTAYTLQADLWSAAPEAILMVLANVVLAGTIIRTGAATAAALLVSCAWAGLLGTLTVAGGWTMLGAALGVSYAGQMGPAVWTVYRVATPTGIAPVYWLANLVEAALWGVYGAVHRDQAVLLFALVGVTASGAILLRWSTTRGCGQPAVATTSYSHAR